MGKEMKKQKVKRNENEGFSNLIQFFQIIFVLLILYLIAISELVIMNVHVFFSNIGWMLMMVQGLLVFRGINPILRKFLGKDTVFIHWVIETIALIGATMGFICAYQDKVNKNKEHFITWHGIFGLTGFSFSILSGINGIPTLYRKELKNYISPKLNKFVHILTGTIGFLFGGLSLIMACYTKWFAMRTTHSLISFCIAIFLVVNVVIYTLLRPFNKVQSNWKKLTSKE
ncbi:transmembrane reductase CYB561D2-like [Harmonia axyridis]|uniref:transmembrane reductase CYB561D2-like n=1 Tax=Harmonia axyridis TaxID=115357 RepID=UPI001E275AD5|nr:transmembrane reductase CYB561D2-like [Harmonia axyridis]